MSRISKRYHLHIVVCWLYCHQRLVLHILSCWFRGQDRLWILRIGWAPRCHLVALRPFGWTSPLVFHSLGCSIPSCCTWIVSFVESSLVFRRLPACTIVLGNECCQKLFQSQFLYKSFFIFIASLFRLLRVWVWARYGLVLSPHYLPHNKILLFSRAMLFIISVLRKYSSNVLLART